MATNSGIVVDVGASANLYKVHALTSKSLFISVGSMRLIYLPTIWLKIMVHVDEYTIHGLYGFGNPGSLNPEQTNHELK